MSEERTDDRVDDGSDHRPREHTGDREPEVLDDDVEQQEDPALLDVLDLLDELTDITESARSMPMSSSCVVNRGEVLGLLDDLRDRLPEAMAEAQGVLLERRRLVSEGRQEATARVEQARQEATATLAAARQERERLVSSHEILLSARHRSQEVLDEATEEAARLRREVDDYVDAKLESFESMLASTLDAVGKGRAKLTGVDQAR